MEKLTRTKLITELRKYTRKVDDAYLDNLITQAIIQLDKNRCEINREIMEQIDAITGRKIGEDWK